MTDRYAAYPSSLHGSHPPCGRKETHIMRLYNITICIIINYNISSSSFFRDFRGSLLVIFLSKNFRNPLTTPSLWRHYFPW
jgi:hypothetical protein